MQLTPQKILESEQQVKKTTPAKKSFPLITPFNPPAFSPEKTYNNIRYLKFDKKSNSQNTLLQNSLADENKDQKYLLLRNGYGIRLVESDEQRNNVSNLIKRMYDSRGYCTKNATTFSDSPNEITFETSIGKILVGTVTLRADSSEGLLADELYQQEINYFRIRNRKVCELSKFAFDSQHSSKEIITSLFHVTYKYARMAFKATDFLCEVNPRHTKAQERLFGFRPIGETYNCPRVNAPATLLHLDLDHIRT